MAPGNGPQRAGADRGHLLFPRPPQRAGGSRRQRARLILPAHNSLPHKPFFFRRLPRVQPPALPPPRRPTCCGQRRFTPGPRPAPVVRDPPPCRRLCERDRRTLRATDAAWVVNLSPIVSSTWCRGLSPSSQAPRSAVSNERAGLVATKPEATATSDTHA